MIDNGKMDFLNELALSNPNRFVNKSINGASDFGNKFGQPLLLDRPTFEHLENNQDYYDKVIMLAGGIGYGIKEQE